jgi:hypothetical protein
MIVAVGDILIGILFLIYFRKHRAYKILRICCIVAMILALVAIFATLMGSAKPTTSASDYNDRGLGKAKVGDLVGAISDFNSALNLDPGDPAV